LRNPEQGAVNKKESNDGQDQGREERSKGPKGWGKTKKRKRRRGKGKEFFGGTKRTKLKRKKKYLIANPATEKKELIE